MKTVFVDDHISATGIFHDRIRKMPKIQLIATFQDKQSVLCFAEKHAIDLAILSIREGGIDGIDLARQLRGRFPDILLIFLAEREDHAMEAIRLHAAAYLLEPYTQEELEYAVETAQLLSMRKKRKIFVRTFGHFDIFVDNKPIMFRSGKAKELLALLVDRQGGTVSTDQVICTLWEDRPNDEATQNLCSKVSRGLSRELAEYGAQDMLVVSRGIRRVDTDLFACDLYKFLAGDPQAKMQFVGDYMLDYSWAEARMGLLNRYMLNSEKGRLYDFS